ncbi:MAG TPA: arsenite methyltransferase [Vicinamibacteria bacterium]|jgi:ubiquinone/menaquinone biosynthesis C-methylase UbiE
MSEQQTRADQLVERVKDRYGRIALGVDSGCCASSCGCGDTAQAIGYGGTELSAVPAEANLGLGCGAPIPLLELRQGEVVLDLGSGAGLDAFLAAREVGPAGRVIGVDMTQPMIERARRAAEKNGIANVEFREGRLEALPVESASVDAITSNCVINLVPDKAAVFREAARVLKPGGRLVVSDILLEGSLPAAIADDVKAWVGCVAGAADRKAYFDMVRSAGFSDIHVLKDVDYGAAALDAAPEMAQEVLARAGVDEADVRGKVRSVTFRAVKAESNKLRA